MSRVPIFTDAPAGGDRVYLDTIGSVSAVKFSTNRNGDLAASWQIRLDPKTNHRALAPGRAVGAPCGADKGWRGVLGNPRRGDVWDCNAFGEQWRATTYTAIAPTSGNALKLDEVLDAAISRGLPWTRPSAMPTDPGGASGEGTGQIADALNTVTTDTNTVWNVNRTQQITAPRRPATVAYLLQASDTAGGRSVLGFVTDVVVTYLDASTYQYATITCSAASRPYGRFEQPLDLTARGPITAAQATAKGNNWLAKRGARLGFTAPFTVTPGQLLNPGGQPVDLATVQATDGLVRVLLTDPDAAAGELNLGPVQITMGETEYDVDADVLTITPYDYLPTGFTAVFQ